MLPKVYDHKHQLRTRQWVYDRFGFVAACVQAAKPTNGAAYRLVELRETKGNVLTVQVQAPNRSPLANAKVMLYWPDAPVYPGAGWLEKGVVAVTGRHGQAIHVLGEGAKYQLPAIGPHALWIHGPNASPMITGLGIVDGYHLAPTFRMLGTGELTHPDPIDEALTFLRSASSHMGTALDDVAAAVDRLQCLPDPGPEPPHVTTL